MPEFWLVQYLCPSRHCLCASPYERPTQTPEAVEAALRGMMKQYSLNPWCGICGSRELHFEHGKLAEQDWEKIYTALKRGESDQLLSRAIIEQRKRETN